MNKYTRRGHLAALLTVLIWGTTFIATKVLLESFQPVEILFFRFLLGYAALAALVWGFYSILTRKIAAFGYPTIQTTRRTFFYGLLFMLPACWLFDFQPGLSRFADPLNLANILFLGLGASALCFVTWNTAIRHLGAVQASLYIFLTPVITVVSSVIILGEPFTWMTACGTLLTLGGLVLSELRGIRRKR